MDAPKEPACLPGKDPGDRKSYMFRGCMLGELLNPTCERRCQVVWRASDRVFLRQFLARLRLDKIGINRLPLEDLAESMGIDVPHLAADEWVTIQQKLRSALHNLLKTNIRPGGLSERYDGKLGHRTVDWPEHMRTEWLGPLDVQLTATQPRCDDTETLATPRQQRQYMATEREPSTPPASDNQASARGLRVRRQAPVRIPLRHPPATPPPSPFSPRTSHVPDDIRGSAHVPPRPPLSKHPLWTWTPTQTPSIVFRLANWDWNGGNENEAAVGRRGLRTPPSDITRHHAASLDKALLRLEQGRRRLIALSTARVTTCMQLNYMAMTEPFDLAVQCRIAVASGPWITPLSSLSSSSAPRLCPIDSHTKGAAQVIQRLQAEADQYRATCIEVDAASVSVAEAFDRLAKETGLGDRFPMWWWLQRIIW
ncbi:hypothetical protein ColLi_12707 [Colletotrichum liriopes]|uniref:Uncharacterized protein n=1 Tax=Colletotrichum liriopes TaxID=708192 RepID=A0AA37GZR7_9PEZI|nr:hypothetical protein ColLi_12707 [Colletotrichum liriopes]